LIGGSLHSYKNEEEEKPKETIELNGMKFNKEEPSEGKTFCFSLSNDSTHFIFYSDDEEDYKEWIHAISINLMKSPCSPLPKLKKNARMKTTLSQRAKKNVAGKFAASAVGKKAIRSQAPEEVTTLILAIKKIVEKRDNPKRAVEIEENIYKIGIKAYFIVDRGQLKMEAFLAADQPLRRALELLAKCFDYAKFSRNPNPKALHEKLEEVQKHIIQGADILMKLMEPFIQSKNLQKIKDTVGYLGNAEFLFKSFGDSAIENELQELISACEHYTQFHFYND